MFLLIPAPRILTTYPPFFTFHNVSINTNSIHLVQVVHLPLHSTMFLLIRKLTRFKINPVFSFTFHNVSINTIFTATTNFLISSFTFHNVSINTTSKTSRCNNNVIFTFHNVSINTDGADAIILETIPLYIPQCFY